MKVLNVKACIPLTLDALSNHDEYFQMRANVVDRMSLSQLRKCTIAIRIWITH